MPQQPQSERLTLAQTTDIAWRLGSLWATCFTIPIRSRLGCEYPGWGGLVAFLGMPVFAAYAHSEAVLWWWKAWIVILIGRRLGTFIRERRGDFEASRYQGWPWLAIRLPFVRTELRARAVEPWLYALASYAAYPHDAGLGKFFLSGALALAVVNAIQRQLLYKERLAIRDAQIAMAQHERMMRGR